MSEELVRYDAMCRAIAEAHAVDEVKDIRDRAAALEQYQRQAHNIEAERQCCLIRLRAERKVGQLLKEMAERGERDSGHGDRKSGSQDATPKLGNWGVSKTQSSRWQGLADIPEADFEAALARPEKPTTSGILEAARPKAATPVSDEALWIWGRLRDFERDLINWDPKGILDTMTESMRADVLRLAPIVAEWLDNILDGEPV